MTRASCIFRVDTRVSGLRLRSEPQVSDPPLANVIAQLPDGQLVRAWSATPSRGFLEVETRLDGALLKGFASATYLVEEPGTVIPVPAIMQAPQAGVVAVALPRKTGTVTRRKAFAGAHSLNEPDQPSRESSSDGDRRRELLKIIDWLAVDKPAHKRYQPRAGATFCNVYCHDYCHLAGVTLPRTWWSTRAILELSQGRPVAPLIENTVYEMRANGLFYWLREFGPSFGWRRMPDLTRLQHEANQGVVALVVARRKENGRPGHIVAVVPESDRHAAKRNASGEVTSPLQSQAGSRNFRYGTGSPGWWKREQFADFAFWLHP